MISLSKKRWHLFQFLGKLFVHHFIVPSKRFIALCLFSSVAVAIGFITHHGFYVFWVINGILLLVSILDYIMLPARKQIKAQRYLPDRADILAPFDVSILLQNKSKLSITFAVNDDLPLSFEAMQPIVGTMSTPQYTVTYSTMGSERGKYTFDTIYIRYWGLLGLWGKQLKVSCPQPIKIFPDLSQVRGILSSTQDSLVLEGAASMKRVKLGTEFQTIREYVPDDDPRYMNWTASARTGSLMTNVYQPERGKVVTILLDCGRMMGVELDNKVKLDRTLEAALTLAAVALRQGDQVALLAFSSDIKVYIPPGKGMPHLHILLEAVYDLKSDFVESNYSKALQYIARFQKKRSLLVLLSDMESYLFEEQLAPFLMRLRRQHIVLLLALKDPVLFDWSQKDTANTHTAVVKSIAQKFILDRKSYVQKMASVGIQVIDVPANELAITAVNRYLDIKNKEAL